MRALFLGEGELAGPARYLASVLRWAGIPFDHRPDRAKIPKTWRKPGRYNAIILSDYRYRSFTPCSREWLAREVSESGTGLLMIGGWASFTGLVGGYAHTSIEQLLPVTCVEGDDRVQRAAILTSGNKPLVICGYHRAVPKKASRTWLSLRDLRFTHGRPQLGTPHPLLVTGSAGAGRTAAFLTDCAPHWAGGLVDWGARRVTVRLNAEVSTEVGDAYLRFFTRLIRWTAKKSGRPL